MDEHLGFEDDDLLPLFERHFDADEYTELDVRAQKALGIGTQAAFTIPFVLYWLPADLSAHLIGEAPSGFRILWRLTRRRHTRLVETALGGLAAPTSVVRAHLDVAA